MRDRGLGDFGLYNVLTSEGFINACLYVLFFFFFWNFIDNMHDSHETRKVRVGLDPYI